LIKPVKVSDGKWAGKSNGKIGNHHLKWACNEAAILMLRESEKAKQYVAKLIFAPCPSDTLTGWIFDPSRLL